MEAPNAPGLSASAGGSLPGGLYQVACTFERHDGTQSCASVSVQADVPDGGILNIHLPATTQPLTAWVHAIARHKLIDVLRARSGREALHDPLDDEMPLFAASDHDAQDARRDLMGLLQTLPDKQRRPIECVKIDGLSVAETARLTGLSESAVKVGIHRGLKSLAARLGHSYSATRSKS